jgi:broad specificity phosphatase PhoE
VSTLHLIRHGQASFGAEDYDVLSSRGVEQSLALGRHLARRPVRVDAIYSGPRRRQLDTARHLAAGAAELGAAMPEISIVPELDEYPAIELFRAWLPKLIAENRELAATLGSMAGGAGVAPPRTEDVQAAFEHISYRWARGEIDSGELETFAVFAERVGAGVRRVMAAEGRGRHVAVVTSGGPISVTVGACLGLDGDRALRLSWIIANASLTELRWRDGDLTLFGFNSIYHLDHGLVTYR